MKASMLPMQLKHKQIAAAAAVSVETLLEAEVGKGLAAIMVVVVAMVRYDCLLSVIIMNTAAVLLVVLNARVANDEAIVFLLLVSVNDVF
mmetsp:Transcript_28303/g.68857  ORF Transcript_28303/g.68857 Transcript_28303/m.68857 type:complete len:90 (-) Transcript_28303:85-354(-)